MITNKYNLGFTLVELAVVLVILALLTGGIIGGTELLRNAELRAVHTQVEQYISAVKQFDAKYRALPGDMADATAIWGTEHPTPANCVDTDSTAKLTCDGNGDGQIGGVAANTGYEVFRAWQHLSNAEMIVGNFTGASQSDNTVAGYHAEIGVNVPQVKMDGLIGYGMRFETGGGHFASNIPNHYIVIGGDVTNDFNTSAALSNDTVYHMDKKSDDGLPGQGFIVTLNNTTHGDCASTDSANTAEYQLSNNEEQACAVFFRIKLNE